MPDDYFNTPRGELEKIVSISRPTAPKRMQVVFTIEFRNLEPGQIQSEASRIENAIAQSLEGIRGRAGA